MTPLKNENVSNVTAQPVAPLAANKQQKKPLTSMENALMGCVIGLFEVSVAQPFVTVKNQMQRKEGSGGSFFQRLKQHATPAKLPTLWSGWSANATGMAGVTALQVVAKGKFNNHFTQGGEKTMTEQQKLASAVAAGALAALVAGPSEMMMMRHEAATKAFKARMQGKPTAERPPGYASTMKDVYARYGWKGFFRGFAGTAVRDAGFTAAYGYGGMYFKERYQKHVSDELVCTLAGGATAGFLGAVFTHPFDTWKTQRQSGLKTEFWPGGFRETLKKVFSRTYQEHGLHKAVRATFAEAVKEPYRGFAPRAVRVMVAVTLMNALAKEMEAAMQEKK